MAEHGLLASSWRPMFVVGAIPALLALVVRARLREPERWKQASHEGAVAQKLGSYRELFGHPTWRKHALVGLGLAFSGIVGLWGVAFYTFDLVGNVLRERFVADGLPAEQVAGEVARWKGIASMMMNVGAALGMYGFAVLAQRVGRKPTFAVCFLASLASTTSVFYFLDQFHQVFWMLPIMGFCIFSLFAGYAIYFPELFPTHLRSTGTSFCYNVDGASPAGLANRRRVRGYRLAAALRRIDDVRDLRARSTGTALRTGDEGQAVAGLAATVRSVPRNVAVNC
jgi:MFS family permease